MGKGNVQNLLIHQESPFFPLRLSKREGGGRGEREVENETTEKYCAVCKTVLLALSGWTEQLPWGDKLPSTHSTQSKSPLLHRWSSHKHSNFRGDSYAIEKDSPRKKEVMSLYSCGSLHQCNKTGDAHTIHSFTNKANKTIYVLYIHMFVCFCTQVSQ